MRSKLICLLAIFVVFPRATFASPDLKLPFTSGEIWSVTTGYGGSSTHQDYDYYALDFNVSNDCGKSILSSAYGRAEIHTGWNGGYGNYIDVIHGDGYVTRYAHLESISVYENQWVFQGQEVGKCGTSGNSSGCHLHFVLYNQGSASIPESLDGYSGIIEGGWYQSNNGGYSQIQNWDNFCKGSYPNSLVERFRGSSGKIEISMTPIDNKVYYYSDGFCNISYYSFYSNTGEGGGCLPGSDCDETHNSFGPGYETQPTESPTPNLPNFITTKSWLTNNSDGSGEEYTYISGDQAYACSKTKNNGDANSPSDIKVMFLLSDGYKKDPPDNWNKVGDLQNIRDYNMEVGESQTECAEFNVPTNPGVYNIVACADRIYENNNGDGEVEEEYESDNCSTEAVFYVLENLLPITDTQKKAVLTIINNYLLSD